MGLFMFLGGGILYLLNIAHYPIIGLISLMGLALTGITTLALRRAVRRYRNGHK